MNNKLNKFDSFFIELINNKLKHPILDYIMPKITNLGGVLVTSLFVAFLLIISRFDIHSFGFEVLVGISITQSIVYSLKAILGRERPYNILEKLNTYGFELKDYSFPSGHTSSSFLISTILSYYFPKFTLFFYLIAMLISISRVYLGVHYPTDIVGGFLIGIVSAVIVHNFLIDKIISILFSFGI